MSKTASFDPDWYQAEALKTASTREVIWYDEDCKVSSLLHALCGLQTEAGEAMDTMKRHLFYGADLDRDAVVEEIGDVLWYCALALESVGCEMSTCMEANLAKLEARYKGSFSAERALARDLEAEKRAMGGGE